MKITCARRGCSQGATVATRSPNGSIDEHLCEEHAWEITQSRVAALNRYVYLGTQRPFVAVSVAKTGVM